MDFRIGYIIVLLVLIGADAGVVYLARGNVRPPHIIAMSALTTLVTMMVVGMAGYLYAANSLEDFFSTATEASPSHSAGTDASTRTASADGQLEADRAGSVWIKTKSGRTYCQVIASQVGCSAEFDNAPETECCGKANGVTIKPGGQIDWVSGNMSNAAEWTVLDYGTYHAAGWTIDATFEGTKFTNDSTGHGANVSIENVTGF